MQKLGETAGLLSVLTNLLLCVTKGVFWWMTGSVCLAADAANNLADTASGVLSFGAFLFSERALSQALGAYSVALWMASSGAFSLASALSRLAEGTGAGQSAPPFLLCLFILVKVLLGAFQFWAGRRARSAVLILCAKDSLCDAVSGALVLLSAVLSLDFGLETDAVFGALMSLVLVFLGVCAMRKELVNLLGKRKGDA